jgi:hypothetical protein
MTQLRAGAARVEITPPIGVELAGYTPRIWGSNRSTGMNDPLWVRALALADEHQAILLIELDLLGIELHTTRQLRSEICQLLPLRPETILVGCTHNHSGPSILTAHETRVRVDPIWKAQALQDCAEVACRAFHNLQPAEIGFGRTQVETVGANRKAVLDDGSLFHFSGLYGRQAPEGRKVVDVGPIDPELSVLLARDLSGQTIALLANYACHPWLYNGNRISAEIAGACVTYLEDELRPSSPNVVALYAPGTGSDITTVQHQTPLPETNEDKERWFTEEWRRFGTILGRAALRAMEATEAIIVNDPISSQTIPLEAPAYEQTLAETQVKHGFLPPPDQTISTEIQVLEVGGIVLVGLPSEVYVEYGLEIKKRTQSPCTMTMSYCNDYFADLITDEALEENNCPELEWTRVHPNVRTLIMEALEKHSILSGPECI